MKKYIFIALAAIAALSSCAKESLVSNDENGKEAQVFTATMEDGITTKVTFDATNKCALWEVNDEISIDGHTYQATSAGASSTFSGEGATETTHHAYFPADLYNSGTPTLPAEQIYAEGKFNMPMYAESPTLDLSFKNLCGVLKITVTNDQLASVKCITVSSTNCAISGAFSVDANNAAELTNPTNTSNTVTLTCTNPVTTDDADKVFYIAIPAQTYKNLSIAVSDGTTTWVMTTNADQNIVVARNTIYPISFDGTLTTTGTATRAEGGGTTDVKWIQLWENGPKFAEYNVGAANNKAEDFGGYYAWGGNVDKDDTYVPGTEALSGNNDTATKLWGSNWRMPNQTELQALLSSCDVEWIDGSNKKYNNTNVSGLLCTGKGAYASNSVFLPAAGYCDLGSVYGQGSLGLCWSSTPRGSLNAYYLDFGSGHQFVYDSIRDGGNSVRAVLAEFD